MPASVLPKRAHPDFAVPGRRPVGRVKLDLSNKFSKGLLECCMFKDEKLENLANPSQTFFYPAAGDLEAIIGFYRGGMEHGILTGSDDNIITPGFDGGGVKTVTMAFQHLGTGTGGERYFHDNQVLLRYSGTVFKVEVETSASFAAVEWAVTRVVGETYVLTLSTRGVGTAPTLIANGIQRSEAPAAGSGTVDALQASRIWTDDAFNNKVSVVCLWYALHNYAMTEAEALEYNKDIYQVLQPDIPLMSFSLATSAGASPIHGPLGGPLTGVL